MEIFNGFLIHVIDIKHYFLDATLFKIAKISVSVVRTANILSFMLGKYDIQLIINHFCSRLSNNIQDYNLFLLFLHIRFLFYFCGGGEMFFIKNNKNEFT